MQPRDGPAIVFYGVSPMANLADFAGNTRHLFFAPPYLIAHSGLNNAVFNNQDKQHAFLLL